jgi:nicotinamide mononucleotide transporter
LSVHELIGLLVAQLSSAALSFDFRGAALVASWAELIGAVLGLAMVLCNLRVNPAGWPLAILSSAMYLLVFWDAKLYGDAGLQVLFIVIAGWGWWQWLRGRGGDGAPLRVRALPWPGRAAVLAATAVLWLVIGLLLRHGTDTDVPWWDAFPTAASIVGSVLLARKFVDNWAVWLVVNVVAVALFAFKGLWLTVGLYAVFAAMSVVGWRAWAAKAAS